MYRKGGQVMKKIICLMCLLLVLTTIVSCVSLDDSSESTLSDDLKQVKVDQDLDLPPLDVETHPTVRDDLVFYRRFDPKSFIYAEVIIHAIYDDTPSSKTIHLPLLKAYYEEKHQTFLEEHRIITQGHAKNIYYSSYSPYMQLSYDQKSSFFEDFELIKRLVTGGFATVSMHLNTTGDRINLTIDLTFDALLMLSNKYQGYAFIQPSLDFNILEILDGVDVSTYPMIHEQRGIIIRDYATYILYFPMNHYGLEPSYFESKVIIYVSGGRSGSQSIITLKSVSLYGGMTLELVLEMEQFSEIMTMDYIEYRIVIEMHRTDIPEGITTINERNDIHYMTGYLSEQPFDLRPRSEA